MKTQILAGVEPPSAPNPTHELVTCVRCRGGVTFTACGLCDRCRAGDRKTAKKKHKEGDR